MRSPTTGIAGCCARAASGHAAAAPPSVAKNFRRPMVTVMRPSRARVRKRKDTTPRVCCPKRPAPGAGGAARRAPAPTGRRLGHASACFQELSALPPKADLPADLRTTPAASLLRTPPSQPRVSARSRASAIGQLRSSLDRDSIFTLTELLHPRMCWHGRALARLAGAGIRSMQVYQRHAANSAGAQTFHLGNSG